MKTTKGKQPDSEGRFVLEGNALYEIDMECVKKKMQEKKRRMNPKKRRS